jgi:hypothetical protein
MKVQAIVKALQDNTELLKAAIKNKQEIDNIILEELNKLIEDNINHDDYIVEEQAIILSNVFDKYNSLEFQD